MIPEANLVKVMWFYPDGNLYENKVIKYDSLDNGIESVDYHDGKFNLKDSYTYEYDKKGNWITETFFVNDYKTGIIKRSIEYYK